MVQRRRGASLTAKAFQRLRITRQIFRQELQRDESAKFRVHGLVNYAHPAATESFEDAVVRNRLPDQRVGVRHSVAILGCGLRLSQRTDRKLIFNFHCWAKWDPLGGPIPWLKPYLYRTLSGR